MNLSDSSKNTSGVTEHGARDRILPLPAGEGRGEGNLDARIHRQQMQKQQLEAMAQSWRAERRFPTGLEGSDAASRLQASAPPAVTEGFQLEEVPKSVCCCRRLSSSGFTLIEMVISAALMSMILVSAYLCLESGFSSQKLIESRDEILQNARVAMALMSADLRNACPLSKEFAFLGMDRTVGEVEADNLDFATHNYTPRRLHEGDFCEVSYFLDKERESGQFTLWRRRDPTLDPEPLAEGNRQEIARGLRGLRFEYYDGFEWYDEWGDPEGKRTGQNSLLDRANLSGLPEAVRITLWFDPGARSEAEASAEQESKEPPLVFQTVARLNLAAVAQRGAATGSSGSSGSGAASQPVQATPTGGRD